MSLERMNYADGSPWEEIVGYSRAVKIGNQIEVAGTTAMKDGEVQFPGDAFEQTNFILQKIKKLLESLGSSMNDVVRTRIFATDISQWEQIGRAHGSFFNSIKPVTTMVEVSRLINDDLVVEIEVSAVIAF